MELEIPGGRDFVKCAGSFGIKLGGGLGGGLEGALAATVAPPEEEGELPVATGEFAVKEADGFREGMAGFLGEAFRVGPEREGILGFLGEDFGALELIGTGVEEGLMSSSSPSNPLALY